MLPGLTGCPSASCAPSYSSLEKTSVPLALLRVSWLAKARRNDGGEKSCQARPAPTTCDPWVHRRRSCPRVAVMRHPAKEVWIRKIESWKYICQVQWGAVSFALVRRGLAVGRTRLRRLAGGRAPDHNVLQFPQPQGSWPIGSSCLAGPPPRTRRHLRKSHPPQAGGLQYRCHRGGAAEGAAHRVRCGERYHNVIRTTLDYIMTG